MEPRKGFAVWCRVLRAFRRPQLFPSKGWLLTTEAFFYSHRGQLLIDEIYQNRELRSVVWRGRGKPVWFMPGKFHGEIILKDTVKMDMPRRGFHLLLGPCQHFFSIKDLPQSMKFVAELFLQHWTAQIIQRIKIRHIDRKYQFFWDVIRLWKKYQKEAEAFLTLKTFQFDQTWD